MDEEDLEEREREVQVTSAAVTSGESGDKASDEINTKMHIFNLGTAADPKRLYFRGAAALRIVGEIV